MPFISVKLDARESKTAPEGRYPLRVIKVDEKKTGPKSKNPGETYYAVMLTNESPEGNYAPVFWNCMLPSSNQEENVQRMRKLEIQRFLHQFNVPGDSDGFDTDDFMGATADVLLIVTQDDKGDSRNEIKLDRLDIPDDDEPEKEDKSRRRGRRGNRSLDDEIPF